MKRTVIFGLGRYYSRYKEECHNLLSQRGYSIVAYCDNDAEKIASGYNGEKVFSLEEAGLKFNECCFVICSQLFRFQMIEQARSYGINDIKVFDAVFTDNMICDVEGNSIKVMHDGISAWIDNDVDHMVFREIVKDECYNSRFPFQTIIIDIGSNKGYASLFFANKNYVKHVFGYEPDRECYQRSLENINLNTNLANKISINNFALGNSNNIERYVATNTGIMKCEHEYCEDTIFEIESRDANAIIMEIIDKHPKERIVLKCDCEGGEYDIFSRLENTGAIKKISGIVMEWHWGRREWIEEFFDRNNYCYKIRNNEPHGEFGNCFAINLDCQFAEV